MSQGQPLHSRVYSAWIDDEDDHGCGELSESSCQEVPTNSARMVAAFSLTKFGDRIVDPKTTLAWLLTALGAPAFSIALLVPIRESGSLLLQSAMVPWVRRFVRRKKVWIIGAVGQAWSVAAIGLAAGFLHGTLAAILVLAALGMFALFRSLSSIASRDVVGKTIPKGNRGAVTGVAASVAGVATVLAGTLVGWLGSNADALLLATAVGLAALLWLVAALVFSTIAEHASSEDDTAGIGSITDVAKPLVSDPPFCRFVVA